MNNTGIVMIIPILKFVYQGILTSICDNTCIHTNVANEQLIFENNTCWILSDKIWFEIVITIIL